ncbi:hypothetical protein ACH4GE_35925 [Streptomyces tendae]|uniref:hypothetical protein n=1 Tax=Streptomyces tendae TaxID=1932 RepID=UPI0037B9A676
MSTATSAYGALVLAPASEGPTWDAVAAGRHGPDARALSHVLGAVRDRFNVDRDRVAVAGLGDGASYALGLGLANGGLFTRVLAYSPGHVPSVHRNGRPTVFVSHSRRDGTPRRSAAGRRVVAALERDGYHVDHVEHDQAGTVPEAVVAASAELLG